LEGIPLTKAEGAVKDSVIKLNYIFTISQIMVEKVLFSLSEEKKKMIYDELIKKLKKLKKGELRNSCLYSNIPSSLTFF
jgi:hypothetical protein